MNVSAETGVRSSNTGRRPRRLLKIALLVAGATVLTLAVVAEVAIRRANPILKSRVLETLSTRFDGRVELDQFSVSVFRGFEVTGGGLRVYAPAEIFAAGFSRPVATVQRFEFHTGWLGLFASPTHVTEVHVTGLELEIPPKEMRRSTPHPAKRRGKIKVAVDRITCDDSRLVIGTAKPGKDPKTFELKHIALRDVGPDAPWTYEAVLVNAVPRGDIVAQGTFGPWQPASPGDATVTGKYTFRHADLNTIQGIGGMLSSAGSFHGQLNRIEVEGAADVPNFSLDTANHPVPLRTRFKAIVDGTTGDTYLQPVLAKLGESEFSCRGAVVNQKGVGHTIDLDVDVPNGQLADFLRLSVVTQPVVMTARISMHTRLHIRPGKESVTEKLGLKGKFTLERIHFTNVKVQDKVDMLSLRAQGEPEMATAGAPDVRSRMSGAFVMGGGKLSFSELDYRMPGATVRLAGVYSLDGNQFRFQGRVRTRARISQMVASRWKSLLLKPVDPFFTRNHAGAEIPVKIDGTRSEPKFGLNLFGRDELRGRDENAPGGED